jgi:hypothetical protein
LKSIFTDGFIATEQKRNLSPDIPFVTDLVWLTESKTVPVTVLPSISSIESTNLNVRAKNKHLRTDYKSISPLIGGFWRFGFDSKREHCEKWFFSKARTEAYKNPAAIRMDQIANKVGDNIRTFWISEKDIPLETFTLEIFNTDTNEWIYVDPSTIRFVNLENGNGYAIYAEPYAEAA